MELDGWNHCRECGRCVLYVLSNNRSDVSISEVFVRERWTLKEKENQNQNEQEPT